EMGDWRECVMRWATAMLLWRGVGVDCHEEGVDWRGVMWISPAATIKRPEAGVEWRGALLRWRGVKPKWRGVKAEWRRMPTVAASLVRTGLLSQPWRPGMFPTSTMRHCRWLLAAGLASATPAGAVCQAPAAQLDSAARMAVARRIHDLV